MAATLEFEKPLAELETKIEELRRFSSDKGIDLSREIETLENRVRELQKSIYGNLDAWQKVLIARHPDRPNAYDYINYLFTDFIELHGDAISVMIRPLLGASGGLTAMLLLLYAM